MQHQVREAKCREGDSGVRTDYVFCYEVTVSCFSSHLFHCSALSLHRYLRSFSVFTLFWHVFKPLTTPSPCAIHPPPPHSIICHWTERFSVWKQGDTFSMGPERPHLLHTHTHTNHALKNALTIGFVCMSIRNNAVTIACKICIICWFQYSFLNFLTHFFLIFMFLLSFLCSSISVNMFTYI